MTEVQTNTMTQTEATALAISLVHANCPHAADGHVRSLHQTAEGAEMLRLIVRDDLAGAGNIVADALMGNL
jgi:hypothetical protein